MKIYNLFYSLKHIALATCFLTGVCALPFSSAAQSRFTLVALPDTQFYSDSANGGTPGMFTAQTAWVVNNRSYSNIVYVSHMGDLVDHNDQNQLEWQNVNNAMYVLDSANIPYGTAVGNHDQNGGVNGPNGNSHTYYYDTYYGVSHFTGKSWYGGHNGNNNNDHYDLLTINGVGYVIVYLEYDGSNLYPTVLTSWAVGVLNNYPTRKAIVVEHDMMTGNDFTPQGQRIYDVVKNCPNVFLMLCGHNNTGRRQDIFGSHMITTMQQDYQAWPNGGNGYLRLLDFSPYGRSVHCRTYSPYADAWLTGGGDDFSMLLFLPHACDFNGDKTNDLSLYRPSNGNWYIRGISQVAWGTNADIAVPGDYNGDGKTDYATWRPTNANWYVKGISQVALGTNGDIPVPADYNGDGQDEFAVWSPSTYTWNISGSSPTVYGTAGDIPVPADYNGDGKAEIAVWRPSNGTWYINGVGMTQLGTNGDIPVPGDYNGDGKTEMAVWRPSNGTWIINGVGQTQWGQSGDVPVPGDYNGDGKTEMAVWRTSNNTWYTYPQSPLIQWGTNGDVPLPLPYAIRHACLGYTH